MSDYICKDCIHNNYGWCKAIKRNKLKEIEKCAMKDNGSETKELRPFEELKTTPKTIEVPKKENAKVVTESHRVVGKREMLWHIQRQALAIKQDNSISAKDKFGKLCICLNSTAEVQDYLEELYDVDRIIDSEIDVMMIEDSKKINQVL